MALAPDQLPNDVAALQAIIAKQAAELKDAKNQLKARDVPACSRIAAKVGPAMPDLRSFAPADRDIIEQLQLNLDKLKRSQFGRKRLTSTALDVSGFIVPASSSMEPSRRSD